MSHTPNIVIPQDFGFCDGVLAADTLLSDVSRIAAEFGVDEVYGLHDVVHNEQVVGRHALAGVTFVQHVDELPDNSIAVPSAHGVGEKTKFEMWSRGITEIDAACPLVRHTHIGVEMARRKGEKVLYVSAGGNPAELAPEDVHDEVAGIVDTLHHRFDRETGALYADTVEHAFLSLSDELTSLKGILSVVEQRYRIITQTTLHAEKCFDFRDRLKARILEVQPDASVKWSRRGDVCAAVADRQKGIAQLVEVTPRHLIVVTDPKSANGMKYAGLARELVAQSGQETDVHTVANADELKKLGKLEGAIGLTASASTEDVVTFEVARALGGTDDYSVERRPFKIPDGDVVTIRQKIKAHVERQRVA